MAQGAAGTATAAPTGGAGNPFQLATNLYAEKNFQGLQAATLLTAAAQFANGGAINAGQYLRRLNLIVRTSVVGTVGFGATVSDLPWNILTNVDLLNVDGSEILYTMGGFAHYLAQKYGRPWLGDPAAWQDASVSESVAPQFTLPLQPEIRWSAGVLANTDTRSQYRFDYTIDSPNNFLQGGTTYTVFPTLTVTPYMDAWAQPDATDLQGTANQPVPPGLNLQVKRRHQINTLNLSGSDNIIQSALTGNALRLQILVTRNGSPSIRADGFTDPFTWQIDNRSLGKYSTNPRLAAGSAVGANSGGDFLNQRALEFYAKYFTTLTTSLSAAATQYVATAYAPYSREIGVYIFPRFLQPGELYGEGWLYTANSTKEIFESSSSAALTTSPTWELITDEVYPVGPVDPSLTDI